MGAKRTGLFCFLICVVIVLVVCSVLCHIIAIATAHWLKSDDSNVNNFMHLGLWTACFDRYNHTHEKPHKMYDGCHYLRSDYYQTIQDWLIPPWLVSCQMLAIIALIIQIVGIIFLIILLLWMVCKCITCNDGRGCCERFFIYATPIIWIVAGVFIMSIVIAFADNAFRLQCKDYWVGGNDPNTNHLSWSWGFEIAACLFSIITGAFIICTVVVHVHREEEYEL